jgi:hypothetical protein
MVPKWGGLRGGLGLCLCLCCPGCVGVGVWVCGWVYNRFLWFLCGMGFWLLVHLTPDLIFGK